MLGILVFAVIVNGKHRYLLWLQAGYYTAFLMPILLVAYAGL